jgi:hypothetical protein
VARTYAVCALVSLLAASAPACGFAYHVDPGSSDAGRTGGDGGVDAPGPFDRCAFQADTDPLRYASVSSPTATALAWGDARAACIKLGMDLAVLNDAAELGTAMLDPATWPAWVGLSQASPNAPWVSVDGCPAMSPPPSAVIDESSSAAASGSACGVFATANALAGNECDGTIPNDTDAPAIINALCETPRPDSAACVHDATNDPTKETYIASAAPLTHDAAVAYCQSEHAHLVVIDSESELLYLQSRVPELVTLDFWIGETWNGSAWQAETSCPAEFSWADGGAANATLGAATSCTSGVIANSSPDQGPSVLELMGQELADCSALKVALCEQE